MHDELVQALMERFAESTGIEGTAPPRRYLWTDAFAVCNILGLYRLAGQSRHLELARRLVDQVHGVLGRHRPDDLRVGWLSGLSDVDAARHPTLGGLRIGKQLPERAVGEAEQPSLAWEQDGQYFHYLTKWMHALACMGRVTTDERYLQWAGELAATAFAAFTRNAAPGGRWRIAWKMSIDLSRPVVDSAGQHDPLDGLVTFLELQTARDAIGRRGDFDLSMEIDALSEMCREGRWATSDPLGIGGLLDSAARLVTLSFQQGQGCQGLLDQLLHDAAASLFAFSRASGLNQKAEHRLAFRELGLAIGLHAVQTIARQISHDQRLSRSVEVLLPYEVLARRIESFWIEPANRSGSTWSDHQDINDVMLATSLAPAGYLGR